MKYQTTFQELSKIFAIVAKIDVKIEAFVHASGEYTQASEAYAASDYSTEKSVEMCAAYDVREKARKAMRATFQEFVERILLAQEKFPLLLINHIVVPPRKII